ncbi:glycosyltransferase family 2 protein [Dinoroseobacter sp. PD6]|uniref:glycosyltransferase family 2 protein n=1 Tax=Dinoroseobacter sp. PD6 TaxID=3028384 RepID=UPI00237C33F0|nr:glycosyltransferase family 2 protein [Dinoroseobacter sp. PD6]MDD9716947.1 glycosyltransferase family 2 protein [Dinoroseobacter sp. PD6]
MPKSQWDIVALAQEAPDLILAWAAYHLNLGVRRINLFLDTSIPRVEAVLGNHPRVRLAVCDDAFWQNHPAGARPPKQGPRQKAILQDVVDHSTADWVFHIDVDEFLWTPDDLDELLAAQPPEIEHVATRAQERVYLGPPDPGNIFDGAFRVQTTRRYLEDAEAADGAATPYLQRGMTAYCGGKSAFRPRIGLAVGIHGPKPPKPATGRLLDTLDLLHFDGLTPKHWVNKRLRLLRQQPNARRNETEHRQRQLLKMDTLQGDPEALREFYLLLKQYTPERAGTLEAMGLLKTHAFDPTIGIATEFPGVDLDLSMDAFDTFKIA